MTKEPKKKLHPGIVTADLAAPTEQYDLSLLIAQINANIKPPTPVSERDVFIRAMYIVSDAINTFGGRFPADEHQRLAELLVDAPVLVGHRKDQLPVGRNFHAVVEVKDGQSWVKSYFYWMRSSEGALNLRDNIDGGIYKECSIGFMYGLAECSVCGNDMRSCSHMTTQDSSVWFSYRQIQRVLETSLVYRGATPDTSISRELQITKRDESVKQIQPREWNPQPLRDLNELDSSLQYVVAPAYDGIPVVVTLDAKTLTARGLSGTTLVSIPVKSGVATNKKSAGEFEGLLVGLRGKERCSQSETSRYLATGRGPVSRMTLRLFPKANCSGETTSLQCSELSVSPMRTITANLADIPIARKNFQTREGIYLWPAGCSPFGGDVKLIAFNKQRESQSIPAPTMDVSADTVLEVTGANSTRLFILPALSLKLLSAGKRVIISASQIQEGNQSGCPKSVRCLKGILSREEGKGMVCTLAGTNRRLYLRPIRINGVAKILLYSPLPKEDAVTADRLIKTEVGP
jgi:hypothetical protein